MFFVFLERKGRGRGRESFLSHVIRVLCLKMCHPCVFVGGIWLTGVCVVEERGEGVFVFFVLFSVFLGRTGGGSFFFAWVLLLCDEPSAR